MKLSMSKYFSTLIPFYTILLLYMMLFGCGGTAAEIGNLQLKPFKSIHYFLEPHISFGRFFLNIICNIAVFVPFGFLGLAWKPMKNFTFLLPFFVISIISIELLQYFSGRGTADIDDVFLNTLGMSTGFFFLKAFQKSIFQPKMAFN